MQLTVPQRSVADTGSFPVDPEGVGAWLDGLRPLDSGTDASAVYRGLKHSNRLHNDVGRRRDVLSCFIPVLRELHEQLDELTRAQPLPLTREFARNARLADALLREEAFAFKILLTDSESPRADDARRAMQALARQAVGAAHGYRPIPASLLKDAHQLYAMAELHDLLGSEQAEYRSTLDHYRHILLLSLTDTDQVRVRQFPLVLTWLHDAVEQLRIKPMTEPMADGDQRPSLGIHLASGSGPEPLASLRIDDPALVRTLDITPLLDHLDQRIARTQPNLPNMLVSATLERQTLARLRGSIVHGLPEHGIEGGGRERRAARGICCYDARVAFGHKEISARLLFEAERGKDVSDQDSAKHAAGHWIVVNQSQQGACLIARNCRPGRVQPGELINLEADDEVVVGSSRIGGGDAGDGTAADRRLIDGGGSGDASTAAAENANKPNATEGGRIDALIGVVRWVRSLGDASLMIGVEYLARAALPVTVRRDDGDSTLAEPAIIIGCKVRERILQTVLLPPYLYQTGDRLLAAQGAKSRRIVLHQCLQTNGLFSQFSLKSR